MNGGTEITHPGPRYERVFGTELLVTFSAETVEEAEKRVQEIAAAVLSLEAVWEVEAEFNPEQKAETVDG